MRRHTAIKEEELRANVEELERIEAGMRAVKAKWSEGEVCRFEPLMAAINALWDHSS